MPDARRHVVHFPDRTDAEVSNETLFQPGDVFEFGGKLWRVVLREFGRDDHWHVYVVEHTTSR